MDSKVEILLKKLKALADRGIGGEAVNAQEKLQRICDKHGIDISTITDEEVVEDFEIFIPEGDEARTLYYQIVAHVAGKSTPSGVYVYKRVRKPGFKRMYVTCQKSQFVEIAIKFDFYYEDYIKQKSLFYVAYVNKNRLLALSEGESDGPVKEFTAEEKADRFRAQMMMEGIERKSPLTRIENQ